MQRQLFSHATILCSTAIIISAVSPTGSRSHECGDRPQHNPMAAAKKEHSTNTRAVIFNASIPCAQKPLRLVNAQAPDPIANLQWGRRPKKAPANMEALYLERIEQAQALANQAQLPQAIAEIASIPEDSQHYEVAHQLKEDWAREVLRQAINACQQAQVKKALTLLEAIPTNSQSHAQASELQSNWKKQALVLNRAIAAQKARNWQAVLEAVHSLEGALMYQSVPVQELLQQAMINLYEPDATLLRIATADLHTPPTPITPPEPIFTDPLELPVKPATPADKTVSRKLSAI